MDWRRLVNRTVSGDRRAYDLTLTEKGHQVYSDAKKDYAQAVRMLYDGFTVEEIQLCETFLEKLLARLGNP